MIKKKNIIYVILILVLLFSMNMSVYAQDEEADTETELTHLLQRIDEDGNIVESRVISDVEFQQMKNMDSFARSSGGYMKAQYLSKPNIEISIWYSKYLVNNLVWYFSPNTIDYVFTPASNLWQHQNVVRGDRQCSGTVLGKNGYSQAYSFSP
jgi:hypothetical protein